MSYRFNTRSIDVGCQHKNHEPIIEKEKETEIQEILDFGLKHKLVLEEPFMSEARQYAIDNGLISSEELQEAVLSPEECR